MVFMKPNKKQAGAKSFSLDGKDINTVVNQGRFDAGLYKYQLTGIRNTLPICKVLLRRPLLRFSKATLIR